MTRLEALIFAKYPEPGTVNTRMVPPLTAEQAAALHEASLRAVCERVRRCRALGVSLLVTPDDRTADLCGIVGDACDECLPQGDGLLGERLNRAADRAFGGGADGVLLLGADSPTLPPPYLAQAVTSLTKHDAVLGPCEDGGYYLLGLRRRWPVLFQDIEWGGPLVARQTRERAASANIDLCELAPWYDLDRFDDLPRAAGDLADMTDASQPAMTALRHLVETYTKTSEAGTPFQVH